MYNLHSWNSFCSFASLNIVLIYGYDRLRWASFFSPYFTKHSLAYIDQTLFRCHSNPYCWLSFLRSLRLSHLPSFFFATEGPIPSKHHVVAKVKGIRFVIIFDKRHSCCVPQLWDLVSVENIVCWPSVPKYMIGQKRLDGIDWDIWIESLLVFVPRDEIWFCWQMKLGASGFLRLKVEAKLKSFECHHHRHHHQHDHR